MVRECSVSSYRATGVYWIVGRTALMLVDGNGSATRLGYPDAAVWDLLSRGCSPGDASRLVAFIASLGIPAAERLVQSDVEAWVAAGLLERA